jgi:hypothetical protein
MKVQLRRPPPVYRVAPFILSSFFSFLFFFYLKKKKQLGIAARIDLVIEEADGGSILSPDPVIDDTRGSRAAPKRLEY